MKHDNPSDEALLQVPVTELVDGLLEAKKEKVKVSNLNTVLISALVGFLSGRRSSFAQYNKWGFRVDKKDFFSRHVYEDSKKDVSQQLGRIAQRISPDSEFDVQEIPGDRITKAGCWEGRDKKAKELRDIIWALLGNPSNAIYQRDDRSWFMELRDSGLLKEIDPPKDLVNRLFWLAHKFPAESIYEDIDVSFSGLYRVENLIILHLVSATSPVHMFDNIYVASEDKGKI